MDDPSRLPQRTTDPKLALQPEDKLILRGPRMDYALRPVPTRTGAAIEREVVIHPGAVVILPVLDDGRMVMIRNRRHTVHDELWELPAGTLELGEDPAICAERELLEETGYAAERLTALGWFFTSPGVLTEKMYVFIATGLRSGPQALEDNEQIRVEAVNREQLEALVRENRLVDAKTMATVLKYLWRQG